MRGDNNIPRPVNYGYHGPSPRAWGQPRRIPAQVDAPRTIPTCVGTTPPSRGMSQSRTDHPHVRGDNKLMSMSSSFSSGPSPRAWGQPNRYQQVAMLARTIPTCVGTTLVVFLAVAGTADHPHVRGDNSIRLSVVLVIVGPSPRAWGQHLPCPAVKESPRTIPTCVGTTGFHGTASRWRADHPHVRGDNFSAHAFTALTTGPSPRAWGQRPRCPSPGAGRRTIPTCVGTTFATSCNRYSPSDHPHVRGDNGASTSRKPVHGGPSPRAWGQH